MIFIGIDPGKSGAMASIDEHGRVHAFAFDMDVYICMLGSVGNILGSAGNEAFAVVEHVGAMPKQGVVSSFNFGMNFGWIQGVLAAYHIPYELVRPQKWKKEFSCTSDKNSSIEVAHRLFPNTMLFRTARCTKEHDGMAEALLMAEYARRIRVRSESGIRM